MTTTPKPATRRIVTGYGCMYGCDVAGCKAHADSIIRHRPTGAIISAVCKAHDTRERRNDLGMNRCPKCQVDIMRHVDESLTFGPEWRGCDYAIDSLADDAERNLPA